MTRTRQASLALLAGVASLPFTPSGWAQEQPPASQAPAPIVRVAPRPRPQSTPTGASGATGTPVVIVHRLHPAGGATGSTGVSGVTAVVHSPRPATDASGATGSTGVPRPRTVIVATPGIGSQSSSTAAHPASVTPAHAASGATTSTAAHTVSTTAAATEHAPPKLSLTGLNRSVVVLDPAHGGADSGGHIGDTLLEKNVTLSLAFRLRSLLVARGFTVILTRDSDAALNTSTPPTPLTLDDRAGIANHGRAAACLLLHATGRGLGVHLYSSELDAVPAEAYTLPWLTAQAAWIPASQSLESQLSSALGRSRIPIVSSAASIRPVDSLTCPAVVVELAPESDNPLSINDAGYQEHVAAALAGALVVWENAVQPPPKLPPPPRPVHHVSADEAGTEAQP